jgi:hypothetical protein
MSTRALPLEKSMSVADYLHTSFDGADREYLDGEIVGYVWVIDPEEKSALCFSQRDRGGAACEVLRTENPVIEIPLAQAFDLNA